MCPKGLREYAITPACDSVATKRKREREGEPGNTFVHSPVRERARRLEIMISAPGSLPTKDTDDDATTTFQSDAMECVGWISLNPLARDYDYNYS